jgi:hypothetical protein
MSAQPGPSTPPPPPDQDPSFTRGGPPWRYRGWGGRRYRGWRGWEGGALLILIGLVLLADNLGWLNFNWSQLWPVILIAIGVLILVNRWRGH